MLVFGPYRSIPPDFGFVIFNLSSLTDSIPRMPGLLVNPNIPNIAYQDDKELIEKNFDMWYSEYLLNDMTACSSLMHILNALYETGKVYICISEMSHDANLSIVNESFMKFISSRYDIKFSIINNPEDFDYIDKDGCDFASVEGIMNFDDDRNRFIMLCEAQKIKGC